MSAPTFRPGTVVKPTERLSREQVGLIHDASMRILHDPGIVCYNEEAVSIYRDAGCGVADGPQKKSWIVTIPHDVVRRALQSVPSRIVLGARDPSNALELDAEKPRVYFGTGSETNIVLEVDPAGANGAPAYREQRGTVNRLCDSARLCDALDNVDFFIRNVNVQDDGITVENKDANVFFAALLYCTKHVQAGISNLDALDEVLRIAAGVAGGEDRLRANPRVSFITCLVKSPLQMVDDTTQKTIEIARRGWPLVISSSPQGGSTAPVQEEGMVALINAEILAGVTLTQLVNPGTPVLYGAVPVRVRLDTLHDYYGAPEFVHYNSDCVQMARSYLIPCYSTAGVGDSSQPGLQTGVEKLLSHLAMAQTGAQYIHYAFGLLDRTNVFCPAQAVIDDANLTMVRETVRRTRFGADELTRAVSEVRSTMSSGTRLFARHIRRYRRQGLVSDPYALAGDDPSESAVLQRACERLQAIRATRSSRLDQSTVDAVRREAQGLLPPEAFDL